MYQISKNDAGFKNGTTPNVFGGCVRYFANGWKI